MNAELSSLVLQGVYVANVLVAGAVGVLSLFFPATGGRGVFQGTAAGDASLRVVGALWCAIAVLSVVGVVMPWELRPVLWLQLIYKGLWLVVVALPAVVAGRGHALPSAMGWFFAVWVLGLAVVLAFVQRGGSG